MKYVITFCALMCVLVSFVGGCSTNTNGNPYLPAISGCNFGVDSSDGGSVDGSVSNDGESGYDAGDAVSGSDTGSFDCTQCKTGEECILDDNPRCEVLGEGKIKVSSNVVGAYIFLDGKYSGEVTPATLTVSAESHGVLLKYKGYLQYTNYKSDWNDLLEVVIKADTKVEAKILMLQDLTGYWESLDFGNIEKWTMEISGPSLDCPNGGPYLWSSIGRMCFETPTTLSICKDKNPECTKHLTGDILDDGMKVVVKEYITKNGKTFISTYKNNGL